MLTVEDQRAKYKQELLKEFTEWTSKARCRIENINPNVFHCEDPVLGRGGESTKTKAKKEYAKTICRSCEVRSACLEYALVMNESMGIWGGASTNERKRLRRAWGFNGTRTRLKIIIERFILGERLY